MIYFVLNSTASLLFNVLQSVVALHIVHCVNNT